MELGTQVRDALYRIQIEYVEMPELKLTSRQVQRFWNLSNDVSEAALAVLVRHGFLKQSSDGKYIRHRMLRASLDCMEPLVRAS